MYASSGCGCGCGGSGSCGGSQYAMAVVRRGAHPVGSHYGILPVLIVPAIALAAAITDFTGYNNVNNKMYASCPDYTKSVDEFAAFREKVVAMYGKRPRADVWIGGPGNKNPNAKNPNLKSEKAAQIHLGTLKDRAKRVLQKCKGASETETPLPGTEMAIDPSAASLDIGTAAGGGNLLLYGGLTVAALVGVGLLIAAKRKQAS